MVTNHHELSDDDFLQQLEAETLDPALFNHEAHIRMPWLYLTRKKLQAALISISAAIQQLDDKYADGQKYHHTITVCFSLIIAAKITQNKFRNWELFISEHRDLTNPKTLLSEYYHEATLCSYQARKSFAPPDKDTNADLWELVRSCTGRF